MRLDAQRARGPPLLCHFSRSRDRGRRGRRRRHELAGSKKSSKHGQSQKRESTMTSPVLSARRFVRPRTGQQRTQREPERAVIMSPLSVRAVRTLESVNNRSLEESRRRGPVNHNAEQPITSNHSPPELFAGPARCGGRSCRLMW